MALQWDVSKVKDYEKRYKTSDNTWHRVTQVIVFALMYCGVREITEDNLIEVYCRYMFYEKLFGPLWYIKEEPKSNPYIIEIEHFKQHIGMTVNVNPITNRIFVSNCSKSFREEWKGKVLYEQSKVC